MAPSAQFSVSRARHLLLFCGADQISEIRNLISATRPYIREEEREQGQNTLPALNLFLLADVTPRRRLEVGQNVEEKKEEKQTNTLDYNRSKKQ